MISSQVKEHKRKQNKELKAKLKTKKKAPKMLTAPAVPSGWPFKEQVMAEFEHLKAKEVADEAAKKAERKARKVNPLRRRLNVMWRRLTVNGWRRRCERVLLNSPVSRTSPGTSQCARRPTVTLPFAVLLVRGGAEQHSGERRAAIQGYSWNGPPVSINHGSAMYDGPTQTRT